MKTKGGYEIINFEILKTPIEHRILESHLYKGTVVDFPSDQNDPNSKKKTSEITWDKFGRCSNFNRPDCFFHPSTIIKK